MSKRRWKRLIQRIDRVLDLAERFLASEVGAESELDADVWAYRWREGRLQAVPYPDIYPLDELLGVERSLQRLRANTAAFVRGEPALDVLLHGERGTGKSSAVRGLLGEFGPKGLRIVEVAREDLLDLGPLYAELRGRDERFVLFCDDLSFEEGDASYKRLKAALSGGIEARPDNVLLCATSNRKYLLPERMSENREAHLDADGELRYGETTEEKISLSDRFGLLLPFFSFNQETYLRIVDHHARRLGIAYRMSRGELHARALRFALDRSSRSGRTALQACIVIAQELGPENER